MEFIRWYDVGDVLIKRFGISYHSRSNWYYKKIQTVACLCTIDYFIDSGSLRLPHCFSKKFYLPHTRCGTRPHRGCETWDFNSPILFRSYLKNHAAPNVGIFATFRQAAMILQMSCTINGCSGKQGHWTGRDQTTFYPLESMRLKWYWSGRKPGFYFWQSPLAWV